MHVIPIKMRWASNCNNYAYILIENISKESWLIDPGEPSEVLQKLPELPKSSLRAIINTHHHHDHSGGHEVFKEKFKIPVIGGSGSPKVDIVPKDGQLITLGEYIDVKAIHTPCHTMDSICYFVHDTRTDERAVFTGDTLFTAGCGKFFEGSASDMDQSLNNRLALLPKDTRVYPGHEYTLNNIKFAKTVLSQARLQRLEDIAQRNQMTAGMFTIGDELKHNPFLRLEDRDIQRATGCKDRIDVMRKLREMKDKF